MKKLLILLLGFAFLASFGSQAFANEWVDMGPLNGSVEGHIWSKVVDDAGNTQGRNEVWQLTLPCPAILECIVKCPDSYRLEVVIEYQHDWHGIISIKPERRADGFYIKDLNFKDLHLIKNMKIQVYSRKPSTDQRYQLIVNLKTLDGKAVSSENTASTPSTKPTDSGSADFAGKWVSTDKGATYIMIMTWNGRDYDITWQENETGAISSRGKGKVENGNLVIDWRPGSARTGTLTASGRYRSTTLTGTEAFESTFTRKKDNKSPASVSAPAAKTVVNLALGKPATQSSTYGGTGVDQGPQHAVDGITSGRDPHDLIHTNYEKNPWWRVDLQTNSSIEMIKVYNRTNPDVKSNLSLELLVSDDGKNWKSVYTHDKEVFQILSVPVNATGRHVMARLNADRDALQLYEIEIMGRPLP